MIGDIFQPTHLLFILVVALLVLGPKRLPEAGRALGGAIRDFKGAMTGEHDQPAQNLTQATPDWAQTVQAEQANQPAQASQTEQAEPAETVHPIA